MEATGAAPVGRPVRDRTRAKLLREPLFWAATSAFAGTALGVFGVLWQTTLGDSFYVDATSTLLSQLMQLGGETLAVSSSLGIAYLLWNVLGNQGRRLVVLGTGMLALLVAADAVGVAATAYWSTGDGLREYARFPYPALETAALYGFVFLPFVVILPFAACGLASREKRLGSLLAALCLLNVPYMALRILPLPPDPGAYASEPGPLTWILFALLGWYPVGVSVLEAPLWVLLGIAFLRRARGRAYGEAFRVQERENLAAARRLYEEGLGRGDASVVDELVAEDFRDLRRGSRGKLAMERVFSALWKSYPDLAVSVEAQEAEGDLVRTRLLLSGTDRGGVLWYPPTGKKAAFTAEFVDRFSEGRLVEHAGEADTEGLLEQLGLGTAR